MHELTSSQGAISISIYNKSDRYQTIVGKSATVSESVKNEMDATFRPIIIYIIVMKIGQKLLVYYFFCEKCERKEDDRILAIDNRYLSFLRGQCR